MAIKVTIPPGMRTLTRDQSVIEGQGNSIMELVSHLEATYPGMKARLLDDKGRKRKFINIYVNGEDIRQLQNEATALTNSDSVEIVAAIAGG